jgi:hypothetical protein
MRTVILTTLFAVGCAFGPKALERTHGQYAESVRKVEEEQMLRQLVLLRYNENSVSLDVTSIAAQYELTVGSEARPFFGTPNPAGSVFHTYPMVLPDLQFSGSSRPTVTMSPIDDGSSVRRFLTPISLDTLVFLTQTSWPVSIILRLWVERVNGVPNAVNASGPPRDLAPDYERFLRISQLLQSTQNKELGAVHSTERVVEVSGPFPADSVTPAAAVEAVKAGLEYRLGPDGKSWSLIRKERRLVFELHPGAENSPEIAELIGLMNLTPGLKVYDVRLASRGNADPEKFKLPPSSEVLVVPRSIAQAAFYLSNGVEVPAEHMCAGLVLPMLDVNGNPMDPREITRGLFEVHACKGHKPPPNAFVSVHYRGYWYYIDDSDQNSKATFALMSQLSRLDFARQQLGTQAPALTLPVGR